VTWLTIFEWRKKYGGLAPSELARARGGEKEEGLGLRTKRL